LRASLARAELPKGRRERDARWCPSATFRSERNYIAISILTLENKSGKISASTYNQ
jgi:hypothetical protein